MATRRRRGATTTVAKTMHRPSGRLPIRSRLFRLSSDGSDPLSSNGSDRWGVVQSVAAHSKQQYKLCCKLFVTSHLPSSQPGYKVYNVRHCGSYVVIVEFVFD
eukprot:COSAG02_NODE_1063_length_14846_cov_134.162745_8_plen_103_part_00